MPVAYDISRLRRWTCQVGGPLSQPQHSLPYQLYGGIGLGNGSSYIGALDAKTSTSTAEERAIRGCTLDCWRLALHHDISEPWCGLIPRGVSDVVGNDIRQCSSSWGDCLDCPNSIASQPAGDVAINIVCCCCAWVDVCGSCNSGQRLLQPAECMM